MALSQMVENGVPHTFPAKTIFVVDPPMSAALLIFLKERIILASSTVSTSMSRTPPIAFVVVLPLLPFAVLFLHRGHIHRH